MNDAPATASAPIKADAFLGGALLLRQPVKGHRAGTDAVLLAAAAPAVFSGAALDLGAGAGAAGLALALHRPGLRIGLVENDPRVAALARENLALNHLSDRGAVFEADLLSPRARRDAGLSDASAGLVITNPPFYDPGKARMSPDPARRAAHAMLLTGPAGLAAWIAASLALVEPDGTMILIHRPDALPAILDALGGRAGAIAVLPVHPRAAKEAVRILVRCKKGSRAPMSLAPALILHEGTSFTERAAAVHRGALIDW
ncbi:tRNA1(Val) (adenine(37)-N6)-methyltransferase [Methylocapsa palsarum]|uniref:tRNA1(Val) A37 N6-methylase TrmN6 n=1 Tax=Methylocapsa palsarum TaxID=1612308 RepID=A0A1I4A0E0_9HYPH|nr:methyltransferase [Methylocapsa palsarum]SFK49783.1 tRNA1(Val) A37 N6-methylase TrmN6 [Methylocapsa palsarum]